MKPSIPVDPAKHRLIAGHCPCGGTDDCPWKKTSFASEGMKLFYVTFGMGTIFGGWYAKLEARDENIVRAFMNKRYHGNWSNIYTEVPKYSKPLNDRPTVLAYSRWEDV